MIHTSCQIFVPILADFVPLFDYNAQVHIEILWGGVERRGFQNDD